MAHLAGKVARFGINLVIVIGVITTMIAYPIEAECESDNDPPVLTCDESAETDPTTPQIFNGLVNGVSYTADDPSGPIGTDYEPTIGLPGFGGSLFPPGSTPVTLTATDHCRLDTSCTFNVINTLTELPVSAPDVFPAEVTLETDQDMYTVPSFGPDNVTLKSGVMYDPYPKGSKYEVVVTPSSVPCGEHTITTVISDTVLSNKFDSRIMVKAQVSCYSCSGTGCEDHFTDEKADSSDTCTSVGSPIAYCQKTVSGGVVTRSCANASCVNVNSRGICTTCCTGTLCNGATARSLISVSATIAGVAAAVVFCHV